MNHGAVDLAGRVLMAICIIWLVVYIFTSVVDVVFTWKFMLLVGGVIVGSVMHTYGSTGGAPMEYKASNAVAPPKLS
jgi:hypothetical protein